MKSNEIRNAVRCGCPLIHAITNPISINQCANAALAVGARPIMAEHPEEAAGITRTAKALLANLGNITDARIQSITICAQTAMENKIPIVLDAVGVACSHFRRKFALEIMEKNNPAVIKGNYSEIYALYNNTYSSAGVDAENSLNAESMQRAAVSLARRHGAIILASGKTDIITDGDRLFHVHNGSAQLASITGTGCMLGILCACYLSAHADISAAVTAAAVLGICGEIAETDKGNASFMLNLLDAVSTLSDADFENHLKLEEIAIENI